jgi:hypothetical protein
MKPKFDLKKFQKCIEAAAVKRGIPLDVDQRQGELELMGITYAVVPAEALEQQQEIWKEAIIAYIEDL